MLWRARCESPLRRPNPPGILTATFGWLGGSRTAGASASRLQHDTVRIAPPSLWTSLLIDWHKPLIFLSIACFSSVAHISIIDSPPPTNPLTCATTKWRLTRHLCVGPKRLTRKSWRWNNPFWDVTLVKVLVVVRSVCFGPTSDVFDPEPEAHGHLECCHCLPNQSSQTSFRREKDPNLRCSSCVPLLSLLQSL